MRQYTVDICYEHNHSHQQVQCGSMTQHINAKKTTSIEESAPEVFKVLIYK
jgi:hypothetical protein